MVHSSLLIKDGHSFQPGHGTYVSSMRSTGRFDACTCLQDSGHEALDVKDQYRAQVEEDLAALAYLHEPLGFEWCCSTGSRGYGYGASAAGASVLRGTRTCRRRACTGRRRTPPGLASACRDGRSCLPTARGFFTIPAPCLLRSSRLSGQEPLLRALYERGPVGVSVAATNWQPGCLPLANPDWHTLRLRRCRLS